MSLYSLLKKGQPKKILDALKKTPALAHEIFNEKEVPREYRYLTPLMYTAMHGMSDIAEKLITSYQVDINASVSEGYGQGYTAYMFATEAGDRKFVEVLLKKGLDPKGSIINSEHEGRSYVDFAVMRGKKDIVELLVNAGGILDIPGRIQEGRATITGDHVLTFQYKNKDLVDYYIANTKQLENFLEGIIDLYFQDKKRLETDIRTEEFYAAQDRQKELPDLIYRIIRHYEKTVPNFSASNISHYLLCTASVYNMTNIIKDLNVNVNFVPKNVIRAFPSFEGGDNLGKNLASIAQFLERQDYKRFVNEHHIGLPPLAIAILWGNVAATEELISKGADINYVVQEGPLAGLPIIVIVILCENMRILNCLAKSGVNLEAEIRGVKLAQGELPVMNIWEFSIGYIQRSAMPFGIFLGYLTKDKTEFTKYLEKKVTGLFASILLNDIPLMQFFIRYGVGISQPMSDGEYKGQTSLQAAIASGNKDTVNLLITEGNVNVNQVILVSGKSISPLDYAVSLEHTEIVNLLKDNSALTTTDLQNQPDELEMAKLLLPRFSKMINLSQDYQFFSVKENDNNDPTYKSFITSKANARLDFLTLMADSDGSEKSAFLPSAGSHCKNIIAILENVKSFGNYSLSHEVLCYERLQYHVLRLAVVLKEGIPKFAPEWEKYLPIIEKLRLMIRHLHYYLNFENMMKFSYDIFKAFNGLIENKLKISSTTVNIHKDLEKSKIYCQLNDCLNQTAISKMSGLNCKKIIYYDLVGIRKLLEPIDKPYKVKFYEDRIEAIKMKFCRIGECYSQLIAVQSELSPNLKGILQPIRDQVGNIVAHADAQLNTANSLVEVDSQKVYALAIQAVQAIALIKASIPEISLNSQSSDAILDNQGMQLQ